MAKLKEIVIKTESGGFEYISLQTLDRQLDMVYYGSPYDEAVSGKYRSNIRKYILTYEIFYSKCLEPSEFLSVMNNIMQDIIDGRFFVLIGTNESAMFKVVPDSDFVHRVQYANQFGRYVPKITLKLFNTFDPHSSQTLDNYLNGGQEVFDWRYVYEGVTESADYGLITQSVTAQEDYAFII